MGDIATVFDATGQGDWAIAAGDLADTPALRGAVEASLFTDRLASPDFTPTDGTSDRRGWWADTYLDSQVGSRLWQLDRAVKSARTNIPKQAYDYCIEALQWLIDEGAAAAVTVTTGWLSPTALGIQVIVVKPSGTVEDFRFDYAWQGLA